MLDGQQGEGMCFCVVGYCERRKDEFFAIAKYIA